MRSVCMTSSLLVAAVVLGSLLPLVAADSVSPVTFTQSFDLGASVSLEKIVTVSAVPPTTAPVDVVFLADSTGSMSGTIRAVATSASAILSSTSTLGDMQYGVCEYRDEGDYFVFRTNTDITANTVTVQQGINMWAAGGGGDYYEAELYALRQVANKMSWRAGSRRILVWFGDAPGHDPSVDGVTLGAATGALVSANVRVEAIDVGSMNGAGQAQHIATATGGHLYTGISNSAVVATIQSAITTAILTYKRVSIDLSHVPAGVTAIATSPFLGSWQRDVDRSFTFTVTFTGTAGGVYNFVVNALVDGGVVATENDALTVIADVNECEAGTANCPVHTHCVNTIGSYYCEPDPGWIVTNGTVSDVDECADLSIRRCSYPQYCVNTDGSFICSLCPAGYESNDGFTCINIDECARGTFTCTANSHCSDLVGSYECICNSGYAPDTSSGALVCNDVNECAVGAPRVCFSGEVCSNNDGSYTCQLCAAGYHSVDGITCVNIDECVSGTSSCPLHSHCVDSIGSYVCECDNGFLAAANHSSLQCNDINECANYNGGCSPNAECTNTIGSFTCVCEKYWTGNGTFCEPDCTASHFNASQPFCDEQVNGPASGCLNLGKCYNKVPGKPATAYCQCQAMNVGCRCQLCTPGYVWVRTACYSCLPSDKNPCYGRGVCYGDSVSGTVKCKCDAGWTGAICQYKA